MQEGEQGTGPGISSSAFGIKVEADLPQPMCILPNALQNGSTLY